MDEPYDLERFVAAQASGDTYNRAVDELRTGRKTSHWMWYVFPQLRGLGTSSMSQRFAIASIGEARAYLSHPVLGPRLIECAAIIAGTHDRSAVQIFGSIDTLKLHSSMTLFARAAPTEAAFGQVLDRFFDGAPDTATEGLLSSR